MAQYTDDNRDHWLIKLLHKKGFTGVQLQTPTPYHTYDHPYKFTCDQTKDVFNLGFDRKDVLHKVRHKINYSDKDALGLKTLVNWLKSDYTNGYSLGYGGNKDKISLAWVSFDLKCGIVTFKGGKGWAGNYMEPAYYPTTHHVFANNGKRFAINKLFSVEGRLTNEKFYQCLDFIKKHFYSE